MTPAERPVRPPRCGQGPRAAPLLAAAALLLVACGKEAVHRSITVPADAAPGDASATPSPAVPDTVSPVDAATGRDDALAADAALPPLELRGTLLAPETAVRADKHFSLSLRLENAGPEAVRLRPAPDGESPAGSWHIARADVTIADAPCLGTALEEADARWPLELPAGGFAETPLPPLRAPTAFGPVFVRLELRLLDEDGRSTVVRTPDATVEVTWAGLSVLHIGDSLVAGGLEFHLGARVRAAGGRYRSDGWVSSNAPKWLGSDRLPQLLRDNAPDIVLVTLGANEYEVPAPEEYLSWWERLAERLGHRRCFWIGPPRLPGVDAFVELAAKHTGPCPFFDSRSVAVPDTGRARDHFTREGAVGWADAIWTWLGTRWRP
jgi:hypothetical protein